MRSGGIFALMRLVALPVMVAFGGLFLLVACAGSSPGTTAGSQQTPASAAAKTSAPAAQDKPEACPLLNKQDVEIALGKPVLNADILEADIQVGETLRSCGYRHPERPDLILVSVIVKSGSQAKTGFQTRKSLASDPKSIAGLGDDAFWVESDDNLEILKGENAVVLTIADEAASDKVKVAQELAPKVLGRLPTSPAPAGSTPAAAAQSSTNSGAILAACSLLTKQEVASALGKPVLDPVDQRAGPMVNCAYKDPDHPIITLVGVSIFVTKSSSEAKAVFDMQKKAAVDAKTVAGLGDDAYWTEILGNLEVLKGKYDVNLDIASDASADRLEVAQGLAAKVLDRLP